MILLIDAYNILKRIYSGQYISESQKGMFVNQIIKYCSLGGTNKNLKAIIVFDAGGNTYPDIESRANVTVVHSGSRINADDYIKEYIEKNRNKAEFLLVSSDRELKKYAQKFNIESVGGYEFYQMVTQNEHENKNLSTKKIKIIKKELLEDEEGSENSELDKLMERSAGIKFEKIDLDEIENSASTRSSNSKRPSKQDRKLLKIVKKL